MLHKDLIRHARDFYRLFRAHKWERDDQGQLYFPAARASIGGQFLHEDGTSSPNTWTDDGADYVLTAALNNGNREAGFYFAPFANSFTPTRTLKAAQFPTLAGEIVSPTLGYSETTRRPWTPTAASAGVMVNPADQASITVVTDATLGAKLTIRGMGLLSRSVKGATDGLLIAAARYANERDYYNGDRVPLQYELRLFPQ